MTVMFHLTSDTLAVTLWSAQEIGGLSKLGVELFIFGYGDYCGKCQEIKLFCYFILAAENIAFIIFAETQNLTQIVFLEPLKTS